MKIFRFSWVIAGIQQIYFKEKYAWDIRKIQFRKENYKESLRTLQSHENVQ